MNDFICHGYINYITEKKSNSGVSFLTFQFSKSSYDPKTKASKWINIKCVSFGKTAENIAKYLCDKDLILIQGELGFDVFKNSQGVEVEKPIIKVSDFKLMKKSEIPNLQSSKYKQPAPVNNPNPWRQEAVWDDQQDSPIMPF